MKRTVFLQFLSHSTSCACLLHAGNAAIVLRSRLKVRVLKANMEKKARVDEKGIILTNGDVESSWKAVQYQVTAKETNQSAGFSPASTVPSSPSDLRRCDVCRAGSPSRNADGNVT